jgi:hypothetical protein
MPFAPHEKAEDAERFVAAALAGGLIASDRSAYPATPADAVRAYEDVLKLIMDKKRP